VRGRVCKWACKPNSVEDDHSSRRRIAAPLKRPTRRFPTVPANRDRNPGERAGPARIRGPGLAVGFPPYLVLLRVGFTLPPPLQTARCALTAPFHPYPRRWSPGRYVLCGTGRLWAFTLKSRTLSGTLPCGVRTFLSRSTRVLQQRPPGTPAILML